MFRKDRPFSIFFCALMLTLCSHRAAAQLNYEFTEGKVLIKGRVTDLKTEESVANANIWITNQRKGITAQGDGTFTMYVYPTDTLRFSSIGYIAKTIPVFAIPDKDRYTIDMALVPDIYSLKTVTIYPFKDRDGFIEAFLEAKGVYKSFNIAGFAPISHHHKEKAQFYNPISAIFNQVQKNKQAADSDFKP